MRKFTESGVQSDMLEWLESVGWSPWGEPESRGWGSEELDERFGRERDQVVYWGILREKLVELNPKVDYAAAGDVVESLKRDLNVENLVEANKAFYKILRNGKRYTLGPEHDNETVRVRLVAHPDDPERDYSVGDNRFDAVSEFPVELRSSIRPDIVLFVNGIPLVTSELKSSAQEATAEDAVKDMREYEEREPRLFVPGLFNAVCDGEVFRYGAVGAPAEFYFPWYPEGYDQEDPEAFQPEAAVKSLLRPETLLDVFRYFVFYEGEQAKIVPRHMQYYAANKIVNRVDRGEPRKGLIWHTQGSGKSYTMLFAAYKGKKAPWVEEKQYVLIVDRKKLDEQMEDTLAEIDFPLSKVAESIDHLGELLGQNKAQLILTTIHKFGGVDDEVKADVDLDTVVMVDEAHRYMEEKLGNRLKAAVPDAFYFGFTGTPVAEGKDPADRNTFQEFSPEEDGGYLDRYSLHDGERDGVITSVTFTLKDVPWEIPDEAGMDLEFEGSFNDLEPEERRKVLKEYVNRTELSELRPRLEKVVADIERHFRLNLGPIGFKGMVVTPSKRAAALYGEELEKYFDREEVEVVISSSGDDPEEVRRHYLSDEEERQVLDRFEEKGKNPKLLVVCDKLLTGFDAPILKTLYLDKDMKNHRLLQAIARTNRPMEGKSNGEIVDYAGVFVDPQEVLEYDDVEFVAEVAKSTDELAEEFLEKLEELLGFFADVEFDNSPRTLQRCVVELEKEPEKGHRFESLYEETEDLYESVSPHEKLGGEEVERQWAILSQIYNMFRKTEGDEKVLGDEVRAKTRAVLERHIDFEEPGFGKSVEYELPERDVKVVEEADPEYAVVDEAGRMRHTYEREEEKNPVYSSLSDRVKRVLEKWRGDEIGAEEAMGEIREIKEEEERIRSEREERGLSEAEFSIYELLLEDYGGFVSGEGEAAELAEEIGEKASGISFEGNLSQVRRSLRSELIRLLVDRGKVELAKHDEKAFLDAAITYLIANE